MGRRKLQTYSTYATLTFVGNYENNLLSSVCTGTDESYLQALTDEKPHICCKRERKEKKLIWLANICLKFIYKHPMLKSLLTLASVYHKHSLVLMDANTITKKNKKASSIFGRRHTRHRCFPFIYIITKLHAKI